MQAAGFYKLLTLSLLFILLSACAAGISAVLTGPVWSLLWESLLFGLLLGWSLAAFHWRAGWSALVVILAGLGFSLWIAGGMNARIGSVVNEFVHLISSMVTALTIKGANLTPLGEAVQRLFASQGVVLGRAAVWMKGLFTGQAIFDPVAAAIVWSNGIWLVAAWAGWMVGAGKNALLAVLPAVLLNLSTLSYGRYNSASTYIILGTTLVLVAIVQYGQRERDWVSTKVAYPQRKSRQVSEVSLLITILLVVLAAFVSSLSIQRISQWTAGLRGSSPQEQSGLAKSLGIQPAITPTPDTSSSQRNPGLPRELLVGSGPELSHEQVMSVQVDDLGGLLQGGQLPPLYWRSYTYDIYTGHGWSTSMTDQVIYQAGQPMQPPNLPGHQLVTETIRSFPGQGGSIYAAGEPVVIDTASSAAWRTFNDLFGMQIESSGYVIQSLVPIANEMVLKQAGEDYPNWVLQRYLAVPTEVPARVRQLAIQLTAGEPTPYDRARTIEQYLRSTYPYSLDVPLPPASRDLVDYFLFDLRKGYCDYYASAMVILTRSAGIPARLAIGYASGTYNLNSKRFIVTQADAHSWVEVYFPDIGWVPFEPTAGLPAINRNEQLLPPITPAPTMVPPPPSGTGGISLSKPAGLTLLCAVLLASGAWIAWAELHLHRLKPQQAASEVYRRLRRYDQLLGVPFTGGETPLEVCALLERQIEEASRGGSLEDSGNRAVGQAIALTNLIVRLSYRPDATGTSTSREIISLWNKLRWKLRLLWTMQQARAILQRFQPKLPQDMSAIDEKGPA
ncbi:MAG: transglutaminase domain-containing protein [Anaerolineae bacterium]|nr:transglutaminase domain-containing protein [Anaerolineae bacterium]